MTSNQKVGATVGVAKAQVESGTGVKAASVVVMEVVVVVTVVMVLVAAVEATVLVVRGMRAVALAAGEPGVAAAAKEEAVVRGHVASAEAGRLGGVVGLEVATVVAAEVAMAHVRHGDSRW